MSASGVVGERQLRAGGVLGRSAVPLIVFEWTVIVCGFVAMMVVLMLH